MKRKLNLMLALAAVGAAGVAGAAIADVNYDPATGGFVGKGDVQLALGMNDKQLSAAYNAGEIVFTFEGEANYTQACTKVNEGGRPGERVVKQEINHTYPFSVVVPSSVVTVNNTKASGKTVGAKEITGFNLAGVGASQGGTVPTNICPGGFEAYDDYLGAEDQPFDPAQWGNPTTPTLVSSSGGLKVNGVDLPNTPPVVAP